jgi:hypothetical protein
MGQRATGAGTDRFTKKIKEYKELSTRLELCAQPCNVVSRVYACLQREVAMCVSFTLLLFFD